jgi:hypothetical protein
MKGEFPYCSLFSIFLAPLVAFRDLIPRMPTVSRSEMELDRELREERRRRRRDSHAHLDRRPGDINGRLDRPTSARRRTEVGRRFSGRN